MPADASLSDRIFKGPRLQGDISMPAAAGYDELSTSTVISGSPVRLQMHACLHACIQIIHRSRVQSARHARLMLQNSQDLDAS